MSEFKFGKPWVNLTPALNNSAQILLVFIDAVLLFYVSQINQPIT